MSCVPPSIYAPRFVNFMSFIMIQDPSLTKKLTQTKTEDSTFN